MKPFLFIAITLWLFNCSPGEQSKSTTETIAGVEVTKVIKGDSTSYYIPADNGEFYVLKARNNGDDIGINTNCLVCKISNISDCANTRCPGVPRDQCRAEIDRCIQERCGSSCGSGNAFNFGTATTIRQ